ncbi:C40 family peptidase [Tuberibacillus sp. Marseille-P3662]|uniref:C40 family peptidase n=1 Tax=Tuberibacillus sp. Marseille-P3662 TaxID=1965358 RepID=UPI001594B685|nr:C40 family peptidase [Tuberibacillus sp. Marseille-P3662]
MARKTLTLVISILTVFTVFFVPQSQANTRDDVVTAAKQHIGTPYRWGGTTPKGFDCSGFVQYAFNKVGINIPRTTSQQYQAGKAVSKSHLKRGDIVFFETYKSGPSHSGIYIGGGDFIHTSSTDGVTIDNINSPYYWGPKYLGARRVINEPIKKQDVDPKPLSNGHYYDVAKSYWAYEKITKLSKNNVINGYKDDTFRPRQTISRAEVAQILANHFNLDTSSSSGSFSDVSSNFWGAGAINAADKAGYIDGYKNGTFKPNQPITRQEVAALFTKVFNLSADTRKVDFKDVSEDDWSYDSIQAMAAAGLTTGYKNNTFKPKEETTRAEFVVFLYRALY